jgi:hypothetical protein
MATGRNLLESLRHRAGRVAGLAILAAFASLILSNLVVDLRLSDQGTIHRGREVADWFHVYPHDIEQVARLHGRHTVFGRAAIYYWLRYNIAGAHLTIPAELAWIAWDLEKVARLEVSVAASPPRLEAGFARRVRGSAVARDFSPGPRLKKMYLLTERGARRYVIARADGKDVYVVPEPTYLAHRAPEAASP